MSEKKKPGPKPTGKGKLVGVRLLPDLLSKVDTYRKSFDPELTRPEAVRRLLLEQLGAQNDWKNEQQ